MTLVDPRFTDSPPPPGAISEIPGAPPPMAPPLARLSDPQLDRLAPYNREARAEQVRRRMQREKSDASVPDLSVGATLKDMFGWLLPQPTPAEEHAVRAQRVKAEARARESRRKSLLRRVDPAAAAIISTGQAGLPVSMRGGDPFGGPVGAAAAAAPPALANVPPIGIPTEPPADVPMDLRPPHPGIALANMATRAGQPKPMPPGGPAPSAGPPIPLTAPPGPAAAAPPVAAPGPGPGPGPAAADPVMMQMLDLIRQGQFPDNQDLDRGDVNQWRALSDLGQNLILAAQPGPGDKVKGPGFARAFGLGAKATTEGLRERKLASQAAARERTNKAFEQTAEVGGYAQKERHHAQEMQLDYEKLKVDRETLASNAELKTLMIQQRIEAQKAANDIALLRAQIAQLAVEGQAEGRRIDLGQLATSITDKEEDALKNLQEGSDYIQITDPEEKAAARREIYRLYDRLRVSNGLEPMHADEIGAGGKSSAPSTQAGSGGLPTISTQADYTKLPSGQKYRAPDGSIRIKR